MNILPVANLLILLLLFAYKPIKAEVLPGATQTEAYLELLEGKTIGVVANQASLVGERHLVDTLLDHGIDISTIFTPEHGFRGEAEAGALIDDGVDGQTLLPLVSLYGNHKKPKEEDLRGIDMMVFDLQDVGVRFYTYISTLHYVMEACAEKNIPLLILDRPNPNIHYVDGPILKPEFQSFVGMHPVPIVYGMTIGEYAHMINGEKWLQKGVQCLIKVVQNKNYGRQSTYELPIPPSPNLPNQNSIYLYPSLCLFEGTNVSVGRGTDYPFQIIGSPYFKGGDIDFTPSPIRGKSEAPKHNGVKCNGLDLRDKAWIVKENGALVLKWLIEFYDAAPEKDAFFTPFFEKLTGTSSVREMIRLGKSAAEIQESWQAEVRDFKNNVRSKYLIY